MRRRVLNASWIDKIIVNIGRARKRPQRHVRLKERLGLNRGKALGLPLPPPKTRFQEKLADRKRSAWIKAMKTPF